MRKFSSLYVPLVAMVALGCGQTTKTPDVASSASDKGAAPGKPSAGTSDVSGLAGDWKMDFTGKSKKLNDDLNKVGHGIFFGIKITADGKYTYTQGEAKGKMKEETGTVSVDGEKVHFKGSGSPQLAPAEWKLKGDHLILMPDGEANGTQFKR